VFKVELRHLRYFIAVAEELSFSQAANRLNMAQPPLSQQIKKLEEELGVSLFYRTKRQVVLTDAGKIFLEQAYQIFADCDRACDMAQKTARGELGHLVIGFTGVASFDILPRLISFYRSMYPRVELILRQLGTAEQVQELLGKKIQVGILCLPVENSELNFEVIQKEPFVVALPKTHVLASRIAPIEVSELAQEEFIMTTRKVGQGYYDVIINICQQAGFSPNIAQKVHELQTTVSLIAAGMGIALMPYSIQKFQTPGVVYKRLKNTISMLETSIAWRKDETSPSVQSFLAVTNMKNPFVLS
jgi:DNA-binding transcriptional LysR family regulator